MSDPVGDARKGGPPPTPDLVHFQATVVDCQLSMTLTFAHGTELRYGTDWEIDLDTDENPATGFPGRDADHSDAAKIGAEYWLEPNADASMANLIRVGPPQHAVPVPFTVTGDQVNVVIPLASLGNDDGRMVFSVTADRRLGPKTFTTLLDYLPDLGAALPRTR